MAKERVCTSCEFNNNGWCTMLKTNKGLRDLITCEFKSDSRLGLIRNLIVTKTNEYMNNPSEIIKGEIEGLKTALSIMETK